MERNSELVRVAAIFVGDWKLEITDQWWLDDPSTVTTGTAKGEWLDNSFVRLQTEIDGRPAWDWVFGRSDARSRFVSLDHDERGVQRLFDLTIDDDMWVMTRADPDFHQRLVGRIEGPDGGPNGRLGRSGSDVA